jgi:S1-C subfamily serine protease
MRRLGVWLAGVALLWGCAGPPTPETAAPPALVACYDATRQVITRTWATACPGEIVDDERAAAIAAERAARTRQAIASVPPAAARRPAGSGTGFFVDPDGAILTSGHVVAGCSTVTVDTADGIDRAVRVVARDARQDLALLRGDLPAPAVAAFNPRPRDSALVDVALIGFPERAMQPTATPVFLALDQLDDASDQYLFHGDVHHGHSGAPIVDATGRVIGVTRAMVDTPRTFRATGKIITEIGLAIANRAALAFLADNGVRYATAAPAAAGGERLTPARGFVVHVRCWKP